MERRWRGRAARQRRVAMIGGGAKRGGDWNLDCIMGLGPLRVLVGFKCSPVPLDWRFPEMLPMKENWKHREG